MLRLPTLLLVLPLVVAPCAVAPAQTQFRELVRTVLPPATSGAQCIAVGDVDGDGDLDLALGQPSGVVRLYLNQCGGVFRDETLRFGVAPPGAVQGIAFADLDRDGRLDLVVATAVRVRVLMQRGGTFRDESATRLPAASDNSRAVVVFDADRDGDLDLFLPNLGQDRLYRNDGAGLFTDATATTLPADVDDSRAAVAVDYDLDGAVDLLVGNNGRDRLLHNDGRGTFIDASSALNAPAEETLALAAGDFDRDGDMDIFASRRDGTAVYWNLGSGWFDNRFDFDPGQALALGDVDRDGWVDLFAAGGRAAKLFVNQRGPSFWFHLNFQGPVPSVADPVRATAFVDLDLDADLDLVVATLEGTRVYFNDGSGSFLAPRDRNLPELSLQAGAVAIGDVERDGDLDVVLLSDTLSARLLRNDGFGGFADSGSIFVAGLRAAVFTDVDGDGYLDFVAANDLRERLYLNMAGAFFLERTEQNLPAAVDVTRAVAAGDVDGDGDIDLVFGNDGQTKLYVNTGRGVFFDGTPGRLPIQNDLATLVLLVDLDGDSDLDLVIANHGLSSSGPSSRVLRNDGRGVFVDLSPSEFAARPELAQSAAAGDVDGDGDVDLVFGIWGQSQLYRNDGTRFTDATALALPTRADATNVVSLADVDGDGDLDLVLGVLGQSRLLVNDGRGVFADATSLRLPARDEATRAHVLADFDRDGDPDCLTTAIPGRARLLTNLARQTHAPGFALRGCSYSLEVFAEPWQSAPRTVVPFLALARLPAPLATPFGLFGLDSATAAMLTPLTTSLGVVRAQITMPAHTVFRGMAFHWQTLVMHGAAPQTWRLTNVISDRAGS